MTIKFPPPDPRLTDKVNIVPFDPKALGCNGNGAGVVAFS
jgi:hypothetical protein